MKSIREVDTDENNRRRTLLISIRNIQSMVIEGYELFNNKHEFDAKLKETKRDYLDVVLSRMPASWIGVPYEEQSYQQFIENASVKYNSERSEK